MIIFRIICSNKSEGRCNWEVNFNIGFGKGLSNAQAKFNFKFVVSKCRNCFWQCMCNALMMMMISASFAEFAYLRPSSLSKSLFNFRYSTQWIQIGRFRLVQTSDIRKSLCIKFYNCFNGIIFQSNETINI